MPGIISNQTGIGRTSVMVLTLMDLQPAQPDIASPLEKPGGCSFHPRCPRIIGERCREEVPTWQSTPQGGQIFCHIPIAELRAEQKVLFIHKNGGGN